MTSPVKTLGAASLRSSPGRQHSTHIVTAHCWGIKSILCDSPGRRLWKLDPALFWASPHVAFPLADCALCPFAGINHSHEYDHVPGPVSLPRVSPSLGVVSGPLTQEAAADFLEREVAAQAWAVFLTPTVPAAAPESRGRAQPTGALS